MLPKNSANESNNSDSLTSAGTNHDQHLDTKHLLQNIGGRAATGGVITAIAQVIKFAITLGSTVTLSRMLAPEDFGLLAMTSALLLVLRVFREGGLSTATIQRAEITQIEVSNLFWINLGFGGLLTLIGMVTAPALAWFFRDDRLLPITLVLVVTFAISGSAVQHLALLNRQMRFKVIAYIDIFSLIIGFITGVGLAFFDFGYWALVGMQLSTTIAETAATWVATGWRPHLPRRDKNTLSLVNFGASLTVSILLRRIVSGLDVILLGRIYGPAVVGVYTRAAVLVSRPLDQFINPFDAVFVPLLSRLQDQPERYKRVFLMAYGAIALLSFPFAGLLVGMAKPIVLFLLGEKWGPVIPVFAWISISALHIPIGYAGNWLLTTQGRSQDLLRTGIIFPILTLISICIGLPFGATGVAISTTLIGLFIRLPIQLLIIGKAGPVDTKCLRETFVRHLPLAILAGFVSRFGVWQTESMSTSIQLASGALMGLFASIVYIWYTSALREEAKGLIDQVAGSLASTKKNPG